MPSNTYGRQVVVPLTNKSGGGVIAGDVVVLDGSNDESFTTNTTARLEESIGIVQDTIASNAVGRVLLSGYAALVNVSASTTRKYYLETHTVAKQAATNSTRRSGSFGQVTKSGTTPSAWIWGRTDQTVSAVGGGVTRTTLGTTSAGASFSTTRQSYIKKVTLATDGLMSSIHAFVKGNGSDTHSLVPLLVTDVAGTPTNHLLFPPPALTKAGVEMFALLMNTTVRDVSMAVGRWLTAGDYWIGVANLEDVASLSLAYNSGSGTDRVNGLLAAPRDSSITSFGASTTHDYCIYADILR